MERLGWSLFGNDAFYLGPVNISDRGFGDEDEEKSLLEEMAPRLPDRRFVCWEEMKIAIIDSRCDAEMVVPLDRTSSSTFFQRLMQISMFNSSTGEELRRELEALRAVFPLPTRMELLERIYASRLDNRAYCKESDSLRAFVGAVVATYIKPKSRAAWGKIGMSRVAPRGPGSTEINELCLEESEDGTIRGHVIHSKVATFKLIYQPFSPSTST